MNMTSPSRRKARSTMRRTSACLLLLVFAGCSMSMIARPCWAESPGLAGTWDGAIVVEKAAHEMDLVIQLLPKPDGGMVGLISLPLRGVTDYPLLEVKADGSRVAFVYKDETGPSRFSATLSPDARRLEGEVAEGGRTYPVYFKRRQEATAAAASRLVILSPDGHELRQRFDADAGDVRLVMLLSPTCPNCLALARATERYVLEEVADPRLRVYLVWGPMLEGDSDAQATQAMAHMSDPRVTHFWTASPAIAESFAKPLVLKSPAWDLIFFYPPGGHWTDPVPQPAWFMHQWKTGLPNDRQFNGLTMERKVRDLLAGR